MSSNFLMQEPANYQFSWEVNDPQSGNDFGHEEARQGDQAEGKYYVLLPDGRRQIVEYTANEEGYKPMIRYEGEANNAGGGYPRGGNFGGRGGAQGPYQLIPKQSLNMLWDMARE